MPAVRAALVVVVVVVAYGLWLVGCDSSSSDSVPTRSPTTTVASSQAGLTLDPSTDYGDEYADGILPVGDGKYTADAPKQGYVYVCRVPSGGGGAQARGPWFVNDNTEYDLNKKIAVAGMVHWDSSFTMTISGNSRVISTSDLPRDHTTGVFPVQPSDPAYQYDRNPNSIASQSLTYTLDANPTAQSSPGCVNGEVGVMTTGVALFDAFDAGGRDAGAWEVQDGCDGHPQMSHEYHYHTLSTCIQDTSVHTVIGFALDGFPITGPKVAEHNILTTKDLDECHGVTGEVQLDDTSVTTYHYVMTQDFPYSASCFRGAAVQPPGRP
jgi:hypothetical protein